MGKKYLKLLTADDIDEILKAADIELLPPRKNHRGEIIAPFDRGKNLILCRAKAKKNKQLELLVKYLSPLIGEGTYAPRDILVGISEYQANVFSIPAVDGDYDDEAVKMTSKLRDILAEKNPNYLNDFNAYWENDDEDENE